MAIQILKLGISGSETTLVSESRVNNQGADTAITKDERSASGKLHTGFIRLVGNWSIDWDVMTQANFETLRAIILLQYSTPTFLSFIYTDVNGTLTTKTVKATLTNKGTLIQKDVFYYAGVSMQLEEV